MKVTANRFVIILVMVCLCATLEAQKTHIFGSVKNNATFAGISDANISFTGSKIGCSTNLEGEFSIIIDTIPVYMIVSHLGYETRRIWLENASAGLDILMKPVIKMLQEVEIKSRIDPVPFFKDDQYAVLDFEVDNTLVYLLVYKFRLAKSELLCISDNGDTVGCSGNLWFKPTRICPDCLGYLHVLSKDSSYQVFLKKDTVIFPHRADRQKFNSTLSDCVASTEDLLIFRRESIDHQTVNFYSINRKTRQRQYLASVMDEKKLNMLRNNPSDYYNLLTDEIPDGNENLAEWSWVNKILYKPNASTLYALGDTITIFNTIEGTIDLYNLNGQFLSGLILQTDKNVYGDWTAEIYIDQLSQIPYTSFMKNGTFSLYMIDVKTGELKFMLSASHLFPQKRRVHHNSFFYLYDLPGKGDNKHIFKQKIDN